MQNGSSQTRRGTTGIRKRHARKCPAYADRSARCRCKPSYEAFVYIAREDRKLRETFPTEAAAKAWRADTVVNVRRGKIATATSATLREATEKFMEGARSGVILNRNDVPFKPSTLRGYERSLEKYVLPDLGALKLTAVRRRDLQGLVDRLVAAGKEGTSVRIVLTPVQTIFRLAVQDDEGVVVDPSSGLRLPKPGKPRDRVASPEEAALLISLVPENDQALWATYFYEGLRRGEARSLRVDEIDFDADVIRVRTGWDDVEGEIGPKSEKAFREVRWLGWRGSICSLICSGLVVAAATSSSGGRSRSRSRRRRCARGRYERGVRRRSVRSCRASRCRWRSRRSARMSAVIRL